MRPLRPFVPAIFLALTGLATARADDPNVLVPGDPPLTRAMVADYGKFAAWRLGPALARVGGPARLAELIVNDWRNGDQVRQKAVLADLAWWHEEYPRLAPADRDRLAGKPPAAGPDAAPARMAAQEVQALHRLLLQQRHGAQQAQIRALSNLQAGHHELMKVIIGNLRPSGRYMYNPSSGKYDRWVAD